MQVRLIICKRFVSVIFKGGFMRESEFIKIFSDNLRYSMQYANMTQRELADEIGIDESTLSRYLRGQIMPTVKNVINMAYVLDCDISDLVPCDELVR